MQEWMKTLPPDVQFRRVPVMFQDRWVSSPRTITRWRRWAKRALVARGLRRDPQNGINLLRQDVLRLGGEQGLDRKKVEDMYNSFAIDGKINKAKPRRSSTTSSRCR